MGGQVSAYGQSAWALLGRSFRAHRFARNDKAFSKQSLMLPASPPMGGPVAKTALTLATDYELIESGEGQ
jgi:hypothetical protein